MIDRLADCRDPRFKQVMTSLVQHLHDFARDVDLTPQEWFTAIEFLTKTGQACNDKRQEFILLSDTLGLSMLVVALPFVVLARRENAPSDPIEEAAAAPTPGPEETAA